MQRDVDPCPYSRTRPLSDAARQRIHRQIIGQYQAVKADPLADLADHMRRCRGRLIGIQIGVNDMGGHRDRHVRQRFERDIIVFFQYIRSRSYHW